MSMLPLVESRVVTVRWCVGLGVGGLLTLTCLLCSAGCDKIMVELRVYFFSIEGLQHVNTNRRCGSSVKKKKQITEELHLILCSIYIVFHPLDWC